MFSGVHKDFGHVDGLINNAGITSDALLVKAADGKVQRKMSLTDFHRVIAVDLRGVFLCAREAAVQMIESGRGGVIINISSISRAGNVGQTNYAAAKAGVATMTVTWAKELARYHIRVAGIAPGFSETRMVATIPPKVEDKIVSTIPLRRFAKPEEIGAPRSSPCRTTTTTVGFWRSTADCGCDEDAAITTIFLGARTMNQLRSSYAIPYELQSEPTTAALKLCRQRSWAQRSCVPC